MCCVLRNSATIGRSIAYAWLPADYRGTRYAAVVHAEPVVGPEMARIKR